MGSTISLHGLARFGSSLSVLDFASVGSALSLRSLARVGSQLSVFGLARIGSCLSVFDMTVLGSSLSLRSCARIGSSLSIHGALHVYDNVYFHTPSAVYGPTSGGTTTRRMSFTTSGDQGITGGILHGTWIADAAVSYSDRRLKTQIAPLHRDLLSRMGEVDHQRPERVAKGLPEHRQKEPRALVTDWVLRELRPVSFSFRKDSDFKAMEPRAPEERRYGFVAQEVEQIIPNLVHTDKLKTKYMMYQDLIALLTMTTQEHQDRLNRNRGEVGTLKNLIEKLAGKLTKLQERVKRISSK